MIATVWVPKIVTTDPPRLVAHTEWRLEYRVVAATLIRAIHLRQCGSTLSWTIPHGEGRQELAFETTFGPRDLGDAVADERTPPIDPREVVEVVAPGAATTGVVVPLAAIPAAETTISAFVLDEIDVEVRREDRWRVSPALREALPDHLKELTSGRRRGTVDLA